MSLFLGIDGGQSSTTVLIGDANGRVVGWGRGGPCNHVQASEAMAKFVRVIEGCLQEAEHMAGLDESTARFQCACCGMSGGPEDKAALLERIIRADRMLVTNDAETALEGALASGSHMIVIAGTGSIVTGRSAENELLRAGGWGFVFGDEGSAFDIVRQALRAALRAEEGWGPPTKILRVLADQVGVPLANDVLHRFYSPEWPRSRVASLAVLVDEVARASDAVCRGILEQAGQNLASLAVSVRARLPEKEHVRVAYSGGVFRSAMVLARFQQMIELSENCSCAALPFDPAAGALAMAYRVSGVSVSLSDVPALK